MGARFVSVSLDRVVLELVAFVVDRSPTHVRDALTFDELDRQILVVVIADQVKLPCFVIDHLGSIVDTDHAEFADRRNEVFFTDRVVETPLVLPV